MSTQLTIDIYFDFICPWCLIGKRQLEVARAQFEQAEPDIDVRFNWHGMQLIPDVPAQGWPFAEFYERRLGGPEAVARRQQQVEAAAAQVGLHLRLADIKRFPNTAKAHALFDSLRECATAAQLDALIERLFDAYFLRGQDIGDVATLLRLATECGIDASAMKPSLANIERFYLPAELAARVGGVPRFVFNRRLALEGAQPATVLLRTMQATVRDVVAIEDTAE